MKPFSDHHGCLVDQLYKLVNSVAVFDEGFCIDIIQYICVHDRYDVINYQRVHLLGWKKEGLVSISYQSG